MDAKLNHLEEYLNELDAAAKELERARTAALKAKKELKQLRKEASDASVGAELMAKLLDYYEKARRRDSREQVDRTQEQQASVDLVAQNLNAKFDSVQRRNQEALKKAAELPSLDEVVTRRTTRKKEQEDVQMDTQGSEKKRARKQAAMAAEAKGPSKVGPGGF